MLNDLIWLTLFVLFSGGFVWLGYRFLQKKRKERIELLTIELEKSPANSTTLFQALGKTRQNFFSRLSNLLSKDSILNENLISELEAILYTADIGVKTSEEFINNLKIGFKNGTISDGIQAKAALKKQTQDILEAIAHDPIVQKDENSPTVVMFVGVNGVGKTTSIGKIASLLGKNHKKVVIGAGDTFRAAAAPQLAIWAERTGADIVTGKENSDPASVLFEAVKKGKAENADFVLCDTAGRLHTKTNLMEELKKANKVLEKALPGAPHETLLVIDANTGQNAIAQAKEFASYTPLTGLILTKLDGTAKGGIVIGIVNELKIPIRYIGLGEAAEDLKAFNAKEFVDTLFT